jgi:prepilin-type N-terminal cleavage/methylation domain-containing protein
MQTNVLLSRPKVAKHRRRSSGFTLIEVMITMLIVAILAAIAYPNYKNYVLRGKLTYATNALSTLRANMERYFQDNRTYLDSGTFSSPCDGSSTTDTFTISCPTLTSTTFTAQAVGSGLTAGFTFTVDQSGTQQTTAVASNSGWHTCTNAWVTRAGQTC